MSVDLEHIQYVVLKSPGVWILMDVTLLEEQTNMNYKKIGLCYP